MYERMLDYARLKMPGDPSARDAVQDACLIAWERIDAVAASPNPQGEPAGLADGNA
jgi:DNA-directed RNA polymerase specialized sigma24 family protein